jgi:hypothetical protein
VLLTSGSVADFKYFLPRLLDVSLQERYWYPDREIILSKLPMAAWTSWPKAETRAVLALFEAAFDESIAAPDDGSEIDSWICSLALGEIDVEPFLQKLMEPLARSALIGFFERNGTHLVKGKLSNGFWKDHKANAAPVVSWFKSSEVQGVVMAHYEKLARSGA